VDNLLRWLKSQHHGKDAFRALKEKVDLPLIWNPQTPVEEAATSARRALWLFQLGGAPKVSHLVAAD
jgi:predicted chitinase